MEIARPDPEDQQIDIYTIIGPVLRVRYVVALFTVIGFFVGVVLLHVLPYKYQSVILVTQADPQSKGDLNNLLGGGAGALIGLAGGKTTQSPNFQLYMDGLKTRVVAEQIARDQPLMRRMFPKDWDPQTSSWRRPSPGLLSLIARAVKVTLGLPQTDWSPPNGARVSDFIDHQVAIDQDPTDPVAHISLITEDPKFGRDFLSALNYAADDYLKRTFLTRSSEYIIYLDKQLAMVNGAELRQSLIDQLSDQQKIKMMASANSSFAAQSFGQPYTVEQPASPKAIPMMAGLAVVGAVIAAFLGYLQLSVVLVLEENLRNLFSFRRSAEH